MAVIGVTTGAFDADIVQGIRRVGGFGTKWINDLDDMHGIDGLVLPGGGDVHPERYGEPMSNLIYGASRDRDELEFGAVRIANNLGIPIFGICRGHQVLGASAGIKLIPNISYNHTQLGGRDWRHSAHPIYGPMQEFSPGVNSLHHQAVPNQAELLAELGIEILAVSDNAEVGDRVIVEAMRGPNFISCQWHPELDWNTWPASRQMFLYFKEMVESHATER